ARPLPDSANARFGKTRAYPGALLHWLPVARLRAKSREKSPELSPHRPASESRSDKAGADLVSLLRPPGLLRRKCYAPCLDRKRRCEFEVGAIDLNRPRAVR